ncbi:membrane protein [Streptomyces eurocidicus]|uniref:Membrane protein n=1 Tax=Streptomyces eurocidicus TaxID=66423 RepID=A0A2N8NTX3_STREU|nr:DedA family protein [Streptomyces eurocidicus]MBB5119309.1 membrane-associated protein [Streptomyces eurocidicus]MBF6053109.1 DedA family protein [Streptomyces eurocidicus]PNE32216.1 membrane protein [Streptomyces eurocidicus]
MSGLLFATGSPLAVNVLDAQSLLAAFGVLGVGIVLFAETGLLVGFFLPGDSLLFTAGLLCTGSSAAGVHLSLAPLLIAAVAGTLAGSQCGYLIGRRAGGALLARSRSARLHEGAQRAEVLLERYGFAKAIVLARFVPVVRTVLNPVAGALGVPVRSFTLWQVSGGLLWTVGLTLGGYALGSSVPNVDRYLLPIVALIVAVSLLPLAAELHRSRRAAAARRNGAGG